MKLMISLELIVKKISFRVLKNLVYLNIHIFGLHLIKFKKYIY